MGTPEKVYEAGMPSTGLDVSAVTKSSGRFAGKSSSLSPRSQQPVVSEGFVTPHVFFSSPSSRSNTYRACVVA